jgi:hypothetical protein
MNPIVLMITTALSNIITLGWIVWGFFPFSWWLPLLALLIYAVGGGIIISYSLTAVSAPLIAMVLSFAGLGLAVCSLVVA